MAKKTTARRSLETQLDHALNAGDGILRLAPAWVPRAFLIPGRRLRLHPGDLYAFGLERGGIDERWIASTTPADNGPLTSANEGLSTVVGADDSRFLLRDAIAVAGERVVGAAMFARYGRWPVLCKLFDNMGPIPHHMHQSEQHAKLVGLEPKPEAYYFPAAYNPTGNNFPFTFLGLTPDTKKQDVYDALERWFKGDNGILGLSTAHALQLNTGWLIPTGILHAPGSLCTYEVQWGSDVYAMFQNVVEGRTLGWDALTQNVPRKHRQDLDYIVGMLDWAANTNPIFKRDHFIKPITHEQSSTHSDRWVTYGKIAGQDLFSAKELTVQPGSSVTVRDAGAAGVFVVQGAGMLGAHVAAAATLIRFGEVTHDEFFVTHDRARAGYVVRNTGSEPLVLIRHFGPGAGKGMPKVGDHRKGMA
jgi:hypothetical protein